jgi:hypothetical protein
VLAFFFSFGWPAQSAAYAVLAHEAIIDSTWDTNIRPLLLKRFPRATGQEIKEAHGYAYGGAIIQDMGYYPHGSHFFSDLTHYVRSGDFILALLRDAKDLDGYAFALGALSHYAADNDGHLIGVNRAVPLLYPKLKKKYGDLVTYEENPLAHIKTEFGFDVLEVAQGRYAPDSYHDFIGFGVSVPLLEQAFQETYGLDLKSVLSDEDKVLGSYRHDVSQLLPKATRIAWSLEERRDHEGPARHDEKEVSVQSFARELSKELGKEISAAHFWRKISRLSCEDCPEDRSAKSAAAPDAYPGDGTHVRSELQRNSGSLPEAARPGRRRPAGLAERQF